MMEAAWGEPFVARQNDKLAARRAGRIAEQAGHTLHAIAPTHVKLDRHPPSERAPERPHPLREAMRLLRREVEGAILAIVREEQHITAAHLQEVKDKHLQLREPLRDDQPVD